MKITVFTIILLSIVCLMLVVEVVAKASIGDHANVVLALVMAHWVALVVGWFAHDSSIWRGYTAAWEAFNKATIAYINGQIDLEEFSAAERHVDSYHAALNR